MAVSTLPRPIPNKKVSAPSSIVNISHLRRASTRNVMRLAAWLGVKTEDKKRYGALWHEALCRRVYMAILVLDRLGRHETQVRT